MQCLQGLGELIQRVRKAEIDALSAERADEDVGVRVDEARHEHFAVEIDYSCIGTDETFGAGPRSNIADAVTGHGDGIGPRRIAGHRVDAAGMKQEICGVDGLVRIRAHACREPDQPGTDTEYTSEETVHCSYGVPVVQSNDAIRLRPEPTRVCHASEEIAAQG